jgi:hypothetical protein
MHGWRYPTYRYRVARPRAALFAGRPAQLQTVGGTRGQSLRVILSW